MLDPVAPAIVSLEFPKLAGAGELIESRGPETRGLHKWTVPGFPTRRNTGSKVTGSSSRAFFTAHGNGPKPCPPGVESWYRPGRTAHDLQQEDHPFPKGPGPAGLGAILRARPPFDGSVTHSSKDGLRCATLSFVVMPIFRSGRRRPTMPSYPLESGMATSALARACVAAVSSDCDLRPPPLTRRRSSSGARGRVGGR